MKSIQKLLICVLLFMPGLTFSQNESAAALLDRMATSLSCETDAYMLLSLSTGSEPTTQKTKSLPVSTGFTLHVFRRDRTGELLLFVKDPAFIAGRAFFRHDEELVSFNPEVATWARTDNEALRKRFGFYLEELNPRSLATPDVKSESVVVRVGADETGNNPVVLDLAPPATMRGIGRMRLTITGANRLPVLLEYFNAANECVRSVSYLSYYQNKNVFFPRSIVIQTQDGASLQLDIGRLNSNPIPDFIFTRAYVEEITR